MPSKSVVIPKTFSRSIPYLKILSKTPRSVNKGELLRKFPNFVTNDLVEILYNIIRGNLPTKKKTRQVLSKHERALLHLVNLPNKTKRQSYVYKQSGGFLGTVIPIVAALTGGLLSNAI